MSVGPDMNLIEQTEAYQPPGRGDRRSLEPGRLPPRTITANTCNACSAAGLPGRRRLDPHAPGQPAVPVPDQHAPGRPRRQRRAPREPRRAAPPVVTKGQAACIMPPHSGVEDNANGQHRRQPDRLRPAARADPGRQAGRRPDRNLPGPQPQSATPCRAFCSSWSAWPSWRSATSATSSCGRWPASSSSGRSSKPSPARFTPASTRPRSPTWSPTRAAAS